MSQFYVNKNAQANGDHEVHTTGCPVPPASENRLALGEYYGCSAAVTEAKRYYAQVNGCKFCCEPCHTQ